jgi:hypothetical protein
LRDFYKKLLESTNSPVFREGQWSLCDRTGWPDNPSFLNLVAWSWVMDERRYLIVVNLSGSPVQARVRVPWGDIHGENVRLIDAFSDGTFERQGDEIQAEGLYVELGPWDYHFFQCIRSRERVMAAVA